MKINETYAEAVSNIKINEYELTSEDLQNVYEYQQKKIRRLKKALDELIFHCEDYGRREESLSILMALEDAEKILRGE